MEDSVGMCNNYKHRNETIKGTENMNKGGKKQGKLTLISSQK